MKLFQVINGNPLYAFFAKAGLFYILWQLIYNFILMPDGTLDYLLSISVASLTQFFLSLLGWQIELTGRILTIPGYLGVEVLNDCNALKLMINGGYNPKTTDYFIKGDPVLVKEGPLKGID